jgi:hypothetical protein
MPGAFNIATIFIMDILSLSGNNNLKSPSATLQSSQNNLDTAVPDRKFYTSWSAS